MKTLITGGAGFLGFHLAKYAEEIGLLNSKKNKKSYQLILLDIAHFDKEEYPKNCQFIQSDVREKKLINQLVESVDIVIHAAAALPLAKKEEIFSVNVEGTKNLLQASLKHKVRHFIFISSTAVYGIPKKHPIEEEDPLVGVGPYGQSKIEAEKLCQNYRKKGLIITIIRPKTFIGTHRLGVFEILFDWIYDGKKIPVIGRGKNHYQLLDVDDLVEVIYKIIKFKDKEKVNTVFNIGAEKFATVKEDLEELFDYAYKKRLEKHHSSSWLKKSTIFPTPAFLVKKTLWLFEKLKLSPLYQWVYETADRDSYVSINRLVETLNWRPKYSNSQALIRAYQWYLDNYEEIKSRPAGITHTAGWKQGILGVIKKIM